MRRRNIAEEIHGMMQKNRIWTGAAADAFGLVLVLAEVATCFMLLAAKKLHRCDYDI
jgi:hypothetical protein